MKELRTFATDLHIGEPNQIEGKVLKEFYALNPYDKTVYLLGDIFGLANCSKSNVSKQQILVNTWAKVMGNRFITGNHERQKDADQLVFITDTVACMHGDLIFWGRERSMAYRAKEKGAGFLKRALWVNALEAVEHGWDRKVSTEDLERFYSIARAAKVDRIIVGHMHPKKQLDIEYKGKVLTVLPRGITTLLI